MKIRVNTIQLSKSMLRQMPTATQEAMEYGKVLGHLLRVVPNQYKVYLLFYKDEYYRISAHWKRGHTQVTCKDGKYTVYKEFDEEVDFIDWWSAYESIKKLGDKKHIYI